MKPARVRREHIVDTKYEHCLREAEIPQATFGPVRKVDEPQTTPWIVKEARSIYVPVDIQACQKLCWYK